MMKNGESDTRGDRLYLKESTWELIDLPEQKPISAKWIYRIKLRQDRTVENYIPLKKEIEI